MKPIVEIQSEKEKPSKNDIVLYDIQKEISYDPLMDIINMSKLISDYSTIHQIDKIDKANKCREKYTLKDGLKNGLYQQYYIKKEEDMDGNLIEKEILLFEGTKI